MNFGWTEEDEAFGKSVREFASRELNDDVVRRDAEGCFFTEGWKKCAEFGIQGLSVPRDYGGSEADPIRIAMALEALGYGCKDNGLLFCLGAQMWSAQTPLVRFGTEAQKRRYLPGLCDGSLIGVQAMSEADSGSDAFGLATSAEHRDDHYVLNGSKTFITSAPIADVFVVFASTDPSRGFAGVSAFVVDRDTPGFSVSGPLEKMGLRTSPMGEIVMSDCEVPAEAVLGRPGAGLPIFNHSMEWERSFILATALGTMARQVDRCINYARKRKQFGQPIGKFQAVSHRIVEMKLRLTNARLLVYQVASLKSEGKSVALESALAKLFVSEAFLQSSLDAVQVHGGLGYMTDSELERDVRDAVGARLYSGTSEIQRNIVAGRLGL